MDKAEEEDMTDLPMMGAMESMIMEDPVVMIKDILRIST